LIAAIIFALLIAAVTPASPVPRKWNNGNIRKNTTTEKIQEEKETAVITVAAIGIFFWVLMIILIIAAVAGFIFKLDNRLV
jgi:hypothetical protein